MMKMNEVLNALRKFNVIGLFDEIEDDYTGIVYVENTESYNGAADIYFENGEVVKIEKG